MNEAPISILLIFCFFGQGREKQKTKKDVGGGPFIFLIIFFGNRLEIQKTKKKKSERLPVFFYIFFRCALLQWAPGGSLAGV